MLIVRLENDWFIREPVAVIVFYIPLPPPFFFVKHRKIHQISFSPQAVISKS